MIQAFPFLLMLVGLAFWAVHARRRRGLAHYLDLGWAFLLVVLVYGILPGLGFLLAEMGVGEIRDSRMTLGFEPSRIASVQFIYLCFASGFALTYTLLRRYGPVVFDHRESARGPVKWLVVLAMGLAVGLPLAMWLLGVEAAEDYGGAYTRILGLPLVALQLLNLGRQISLGALVAAIVFAVAANPERHLRVAVLVVGYMVYASLAGGARTTGFLSFFAYLVAASVYVKGFSMARIAVMGAPALALFMLAGMLRNPIEGAGPFAALQSGEFMVLFVNAIDLQQRFDDGFAEEVRFTFYLVDLLRLIPAQLLDGVKLDPAAWYVETFYPEFHDAGGGLAFGVMAESVAGFGAPEAAARGALLALIFAWAANRLIEGRPSVTKVFVYVWLVVLAYQSFRNTTLSLAVYALYQLVPLLLLLRLMQPRPRRAAGAVNAASAR